MCTLQPPPTIIPPIDSRNGRHAPVWGRWFFDLFTESKRVQDLHDTSYVEATISAMKLDSTGVCILQGASSLTAQYKVRDILLSGNGTDFGGSGDRDIVIEDTSSTTKFTVIPNTTIEILSVARWGDAGLPFPADDSHLLQATGVRLTSGPLRSWLADPALAAASHPRAFQTFSRTRGAYAEASAVS